ncbi:MAG: hypothetical protein V5A30_05385 [Haloarculaceae archaeon]
MPSNALQRTVRRLGAVLAVLLAFAVLYLDRLVQDWDDPVVPDVLAILLPWAVALVALSYLTVSLLVGAARWFEPVNKEHGGSEDAANSGETDDGSGSGDGGGRAG